VTDVSLARAEREIAHGKKIAEGKPELVWGWETPAGRERASRRGSMLCSAAQVSAGKNVLEIGCGTGMFTEMFAETGATITAVDISEELIDRAKQRGLSEERVRFICEPFESSCLDGDYDCVVGSSVLHHLELDPAIVSIHQALKPGGRMSFAEPNMLNPQVFAERTFLRNRLGYMSPDETAFVRWSLSRRIYEAGFDEVCIRPFDWLHPSVPRMLIGFVSAMGRLLERIPLAKEFSGSLLISAIRL
jgi:2-polyprenyl-3-methyl-5-hydroxy-6-metoxy-1,4-benzoquinol methylase